MTKEICITLGFAPPPEILGERQFNINLTLSVTINYAGIANGEIKVYLKLSADLRLVIVNTNDHSHMVYYR